MLRREWLMTQLVATGLFLRAWILPTASAQQAAKAPATPKDLARDSFEALKGRKLETFVAYFHPGEQKRFQAFALELFQFAQMDDEIKQIRALFEPFNTQEKITAASGAELLGAFLKNSLLSIPGVDEILAEAKVELLGEISEGPDKVHVITRTLLPRPQPVSCQKHAGGWYLLLNDEMLRLMYGFRRKAHLLKKANPAEALEQELKLDKVDLLGHVPDGDDLMQALCRITMKSGDFDFPVFGCYPVRNGEPAWEPLTRGDKKAAVAALREKWSGR